MSYKIIVAHPGRQHSFHLATALYKAGMLSNYVTTIYDLDSSRSMRFLKHVLSEDNRKRASSRKMKEVPDEKVVLYGTFSGYLEAALYRIDKSRYFCRALHRRNADYFGKKVAQLAIDTNVDAVVMYDTNARECFEILAKKAPQIKRIMDVSSAERHYRKKIYEHEIELSGNDGLKHENAYMWNERIMNGLMREVQVTQYFLVGSEFVKQSLLECGVHDKSIYVLPYGANVSSMINRSDKNITDKVHFLFVGEANYNKGVPILIDSFYKLQTDKADLTIVGAYDKKAWFIIKGMDNPSITFTGHITFDHVQKIYEKADVFVIDSFSEGMAQVGIEAMACGLPIICSYNTGLAEIVCDGVNGFTIPCGDASALHDKMQWFINHSEKIRAMGNAARETAQNFTWKRYEQNAAAIVSSIVAN